MPKKTFLQNVTFALDCEESLFSSKIRQENVICDLGAKPQAASGVDPRIPTSALLTLRPSHIISRGRERERENEYYSRRRKTSWSRETNASFGRRVRRSKELQPTETVPVINVGLHYIDFYNF